MRIELSTVRMMTAFPAGKTPYSVTTMKLVESPIRHKQRYRMRVRHGQNVEESWHCRWNDPRRLDFGLNRTSFNFATKRQKRLYSKHYNPLRSWNLFYSNHQNNVLGSSLTTSRVRFRRGAHTFYKMTRRRSRGISDSYFGTSYPWHHPTLGNGSSSSLFLKHPFL